MSDRVIFGTFNLSGTAFDILSTGFNGFPLPFNTGTTGDGTAFNLECTNAQARYYIWRPKNWNLSGDVAVGGLISGGPIQPSYGNGTYVGTATREKEIGYSPSQGGGVPGNGSHFNSQIVDPGVSLSVFTLAFGIGNQPVNDDPSYWMQAGMPGEVTTSNGVSTTTLATFYTEDDGISDGTLACTVDGLGPFTVFYREASPGLVTGSGFALTVCEYWPYAARNGSPIYNTSTGAQLQDPLN